MENIGKLMNDSLLMFNMDNTTALPSIVSDVNLTEINLTIDDNHVVLYPEVRQPVHMIVIYTVTYSMVFLLGIIGNALVVSVVYRNPMMHSVTNYFIVNLAVADILVCVFCLPITLLSNIYSGWIFGAAMCKVTPFLQGVAVSASCSTLTAIAVDRYCAICHSMDILLTRKRARIIIMLIWLVAAGIMAPWAVYYKQQKYFSTPLQTIYICGQFWPSKQQERGFFLGVIFLSCYTIPLMIISGCNIFIGWKVWHRNAPGVPTSNTVIYRSKVKAIKMLLVVVILFAFSWLPLYAVNMHIYFGSELQTASNEFFVVTQIVIPISQWLGLSNSCVNPLIYCFFSMKFRHGFKGLIHCQKGGTGSQLSYFSRNSTVYSSAYTSYGYTAKRKSSIKPMTEMSMF